mgnify:CR=1 FL=1
MDRKKQRKALSGEGMKYNIGDVVIVDFDEKEQYGIITADHEGIVGNSYKIEIQGDKHKIWMREEEIIGKVE